jgi:hypothetical protein
VKRGTRLPILLVLAACTGWAFFYPLPVLQVENADLGLMVRMPASPGERFSVTYHHSLYGQPVTEEFYFMHQGRIVLAGLHSESVAVLEYFGMTAGGAQHLMAREMPEIVFRVAMGVPQELAVRERRFSFLDFGQPGDRIRLAVTRVHPAAYLVGKAQALLSR